MTMWKLKKSSKRVKGIEKEPWQDTPASWIFSQLKRRLEPWKVLMLSRLERIDARLSNQQRKWFFYIGMLCGSSFLFYLLGSAIREPPASFVYRFSLDSSQVGLKQFNDEIPEQRSIKRPQGKVRDADMVMDTGSVTNYSPLKIDRNGARKFD